MKRGINPLAHEAVNPSFALSCEQLQICGGMEKNGYFTYLLAEARQLPIYFFAFSAQKTHVKPQIDLNT
jgi:hypothetical protein